jgi:integrase
MQTSVPQHPGTSNVPAAGGAPAPLIVLVDAYMSAYAGRDKTRSYQLTWWAKHFAERAWASLTDDDVHAGLEDLRAQPPKVYVGRDEHGRQRHRWKTQPKSAATINRYHTALMALFSWAIRERRAPRAWENPASKIRRIPERNGRLRFLTADELARLLAACRDSSWRRLYLIVLMAITTGARRGELLALSWGDVNLERRVALIHVSKNGEPRALPLAQAVVDELARFQLERADALVFPSRHRNTEPRNFERVWQAALKAAGIQALRFHDLRHTCASYLAQNGASLLEIADVLGHRQLQMVKRYAHLTIDSKAKLINRVMGEIK